mmetsp:Transcript_7669/g.21489  ORF Transcript_7669/g.21489 Transcript_7669/m.21489 type:complete len:288 (+) Transcript_7669:875-1738(+)
MNSPAFIISATHRSTSGAKVLVTNSLGSFSSGTTKAFVSFLESETAPGDGGTRPDSGASAPPRSSTPSSSMALYFSSILSRKLLPYTRAAPPSLPRCAASPLASMSSEWCFCNCARIFSRPFSPGSTALSSMRSARSPSSSSSPLPPASSASTSKNFATSGRLRFAFRSPSPAAAAPAAASASGCGRFSLPLELATPDEGEAAGRPETFSASESKSPKRSARSSPPPAAALSAGALATAAPPSSAESKSPKSCVGRMSASSPPEAMAATPTPSRAPPAWKSSGHVSR